MIVLAVDQFVAIVMSTLAVGVLVGVGIGLSMSADDADIRNQHNIEL